MVTLVARRGRELQRYNSQGHRLVVGCIPYRLKAENYRPCPEEIALNLKVLIISSQKGHEIMFPKGGWETDETIEMAASREAVEEAGVVGHIEARLGKWAFKSKTEDCSKVGYMFPMRVTEELGEWPEISSRRRCWVSVGEVKNNCKQQWMKEALDRLVERLSAPSLSRRK
ncbi:nudix hydrolase 18, mitochondrial-like [Wolffia australiana]